MARYQRKIGAVLLLIFSWTVFSGATANAYVLNGLHVLELMIAKNSKAKRLRVSQKWIQPAADLQAAAAELTDTVRFVFPETFRSDLRWPDGERIQVVTKHGSLTAIDGRIVLAPASDFDCYKDVLLYPSREVLQQKLAWRGVDVLLCSLGRFDDKVAFVLGAQYPDESRSQLWVDKETFRPMRWLMTQKPAAGRPVAREIQYRNWQLFSGTWYPLQITFHENGNLVRTIQVESVEVNPPFAGELFDIDKLKGKFQPPAADAAEPPGLEGIGELKRVDELKKIYE